MSASVGHQLRLALLARLQASVSTYPVTILADRIRATHRTEVPREHAPAIYVMPARWVPRGENKSTCARKWETQVTVSIHTRGDDTSEADADLLMVEVVKRIEDGTAYSPLGRFAIESIESATDIADDDATRVDINCRFEFETAGFALDAQ